MSTAGVYVVHDGVCYKIGQTKNIKKRLGTLQVGHHATLTLCHHIETPDSLKLESFLHQKFFAGHVRGDWFQLSADDLAWICKLDRWPPNDPSLLVLPPQSESFRKRRWSTRAYIEDSHPLVLWRQQYEVTQQELSELTALTQQEISLIERWRRIPRGESLERLLSTTHLPTDALVRPKKFLEANPDFGTRKH